MASSRISNNDDNSRARDIAGEETFLLARSADRRKKELAMHEKFTTRVEVGLLLNVVNPSAEIREGFKNYLVVTHDGRQLNGFIADQDSQVVTLRGVDGQTLVIPRDEIDDLRAVPLSIMPEGLLQKLADREVRDLFAYLRSTQPLP